MPRTKNLPFQKNLLALAMSAALTPAWALDLVSGTRSAEFYPGGSYVEGMLALQDARLID